jgi:hypothetical protein
MLLSLIITLMNIYRPKVIQLEIRCCNTLYQALVHHFPFCLIVTLQQFVSYIRTKNLTHWQCLF